MNLILSNKNTVFQLLISIICQARVNSHSVIKNSEILGYKTIITYLLIMIPVYHRFRGGSCSLLFFVGLRAT